MDEKEWLQHKINNLYKDIDSLITEYDEGSITRQTLDARVSFWCEEIANTVYDHAFIEGIASAELTGDDEEPEIEINFEPE